MNDLRKRIDQLLADYQHARKRCREECATLDEAKRHVAACLHAQQLLQQVARAVQQRAHQSIAAVVSRCLQGVFGDRAYSFQIDFQARRGKTEARLAFIRDGHELGPEAVGGGVLDVASFALRLAALLLAKPRKRKLLILDEPFKHLSKEYRPVARELLLVLARELGVQFILTTHDPILVVGKEVAIGHNDTVPAVPGN